MTQFRGIIAAGHKATAEVAVEVLRDGGNAFDAAVAALLVSFNAEPCMSSPGGGGFANIHTAKGENLILDFFCQTPRLKVASENCDFFPFTVNFGEATEDFHIGHGSHAVPGMMAGIFEIHRKWGSIPMRRLAEPAIAIAQQGIPLDEFQHLDILLLEQMIGTNPLAHSLYYPKGKPLAVGERLFLPSFAGFLDGITHEGPREFYEGDIAHKISQASKEAGGHIRLEDFQHYQVRQAPPVQVNYKGHTVCTTALPSLGGAVIALGLGQLARQGIPTGESHRSPQHHLRLAQVLDKMENTTRRPEVLFGALAQYDNVLFTKKWGSTTHFNILDVWGNAVAVTVSNGEGSGYLIPGTDCFMNNMLGEAALLPDGFYSWRENTRLNSLMSPTIVLDSDQEARIITGTGGAGRIPGAILQVLHYLLDYNLEVQEAVHAPRMHLVGQELNMEPGFEAVTDWGKFHPKHWAEAQMYFGGVHSITREGEEVRAAGDSRRYGVVRRV